MSDTLKSSISSLSYPILSDDTMGIADSCSIPHRQHEPGNNAKILHLINHFKLIGLTMLPANKPNRAEEDNEPTQSLLPIHRPTDSVTPTHTTDSVPDIVLVQKEEILVNAEIIPGTIAFVNQVIWKISGTAWRGKGEPIRFMRNHRCASEQLYWPYEYQRYFGCVIG